MNYDFTGADRELLESIQALLAAGRLPDPGRIGQAEADAVGPLLRTWLRELGAAGYLAATAGPGRARARMLLASFSPWLALAVAIGPQLLAGLLAHHGTPEQRRRFLEPLCQGRLLAAVALSEPGAGSHPDTLASSALRAGGRFILTGSKSTVSLAPLADIIAVVAGSDGGPALFLVDGAQAGVECAPVLDMLGFRQLCTCPLELRQVEVASERVVLPAGRQENGLPEQVRRGWDEALADVACGLMRLCLQQARQAAAVERVSGKPPAGYQAVRFSLAEMLTLLQTAELLCLRAAWAGAAGQRQAAALALCAKVFATENACRVADQALQICAAAGYDQDGPVARALRDSRLGLIAGHPDQVARQAIARKVLNEVGPL